MGPTVPAGTVHGLANSLRRTLARGASPLGRERAALLTELVVGDDRGQSDRTSDDFRAAGLGHLLAESDAPHRDLSVCAEAVRLGIGVTVHVSLGSDIVHMHPAADGAHIGQASMIDFRHLCRVVHGLNGGVWINVGCAVVLPEAFLKAVSVAINLGADLSDMTTANLDMLRQYRAETNVVQRPPGRGISILGQHEILLPLLLMAVLSKLAAAGWEGPAR